MSVTPSSISKAPGTPGTPGTPGSSGAAQAAPLQPGAKIGRFEIKQKIAVGHSAIVWKAYDAILDQTVAIKQLNSQVVTDGGSTLAERFRREAQTQKSLGESSKHVVKVLDFVDEARGLFIIMEYVEGQTLAQHLAAHPTPMDQRQALGIIGAAALALETAHERGILHRDLKPSNIMLLKGGGLKLVDFGLAALVTEQDAMTLGSVQYMAPELFRGEKSDARADIYSLGMVAYEMLAGRAAFEEAFKVVLRDQRNQALRWMKWHTNVRAKVPPLVQINPQVPVSLSELVARMMEKDPALRVASARQLLDAICRHFSSAQDAAAATDLPGTAGALDAPVAPGQATIPLPKKSRWPLVLAAALILQVLIVAGFLVRDSMQKSSAAYQRRVANDAKIKYANDLYLKHDLNQALAEFQRLKAELGSEPGYSRLIDASLLRTEGTMALEKGEYEEALTKLEAADNSGVFKDRDAIQTLLRQASAKSSFIKEMKEVDALVASAKLSEAINRLDVLTNTQLTTDEAQQARSRRDELGQRMADQREQKKREAIRNQAEDLAKRGDRAGAIKLLKDFTQKQSASQLKDYLGQLVRDDQFDQLLGRAKGADANGQVAIAIDLYTQVLTLRPGGEEEKRLNQLKAQQAYQQGQDAESKGKLDDAKEAYLRAAGFQNDHRGAQQALERLKLGDRITSYIRAGDQAIIDGEFESAINQFTSAIKESANPDDALRTKLNDARIRLEMARATRALKEGDLAQATAAFQAVLQLDAGHEEARDGLKQAERRQKYQELMRKGDELRAQSNFADAKLTFQRAKNVLNTPEIQQRLDDTEFESLLAQARYNIEQKRWEVARSILRSAGKMRSSQEVADLLAEVDKQMPRSDDGNEK